MRLTRLYISEQQLATGVVVSLTDNHAHYLLRVLRMQHGNPVVLFNEISGAWRGILSAEGKKASVTLEENIQTAMPPGNIHLLISPLKKEAWDFCIEKATELGVASVQPVMMDFTQNARVNDERTRANLTEAAQQCERTDVPRYKEADKLDQVLKNWDPAVPIYVALERSDAHPAVQVFESGKPSAILIGPEGGFSPRERDLLAKYEFVKSISLGPLILRAETAALTALALWGAAGGRPV